MIELDGVTINAPGFTEASFEQAVLRGHNDGLRVQATRVRKVLRVTNPGNGKVYLTSRYQCSCKAGESGRPCKHRALAIYLADVLQVMPELGETVTTTEDAA